MISVILCDIGKDYVRKHQKKAIATISGICDGIAGFGSILGQILLGPVESSFGWTASFLMFSAAAIAACFPTLPYMIGEVKAFLLRKKRDPINLIDSGKEQHLKGDELSADDVDQSQN